MIGYLNGYVLYRGEDHLLLDVRGVGYVVYCSERTLASMPGAGERAALFTELLVREDLLQLFGFQSLVEKEWHRLLTSVQGIGAKASLAILSALGSEGVGRAIALGDWNAVKAARGVGPKTAQRVVNELKDKAPAVMALGAQSLAMGATAGSVAPPAPPVADAGAPVAADISVIEQAAGSDAGAAQAEALSALGNLGYPPAQAAAAVAQAVQEAPEGAADTPAVIRAALRLLAPS